MSSYMYIKLNTIHAYVKDLYVICAYRMRVEKRTHAGRLATDCERAVGAIDEHQPHTLQVCVLLESK